MTKNEIIEAIKENYPELFCRPGEDFASEYKEAVWMSGEGSEDAQVFNYYTQDETNYTFGVLNSFNKFIEDRGWMAEWYDAGTVMLYEL